MVDFSLEVLREALLASIDEGSDPRMRSIVARSDCYLVGSYAYGYADPASDLDILAFTEEEWQIEGIIAPFGSPGPRPGPGESLATKDEVLQWRANSGLAIAEIEVIGPQGRAVREADLALWAFLLDRAPLLYRGWGEGEPYREYVGGLFEAARPAMAAKSLIEFQACRNQAQTTILHGRPMAIAMTAALAVRAALRAWLLWAGKPLPTDKWLPTIVAAQPGAEGLLGLADHLLDPDRPAQDRFEDARKLRDLLDAHVRSAGGDPTVLWVWPPKPEDVLKL